MTVFVVLPSYNEEENIGPLLDQVSALNHVKVILADDGSADRTVQIARGFFGRFPLYIEKHTTNLGLGPALRTGLKKALELSDNDEDCLVTMDADNSHPPSLIPNMVQKARQGFDIVIASRYADGGKEVGLDPFRRFLSRSCSLILSCLRPVDGVKDYSSGFRLIRLPALRKLSANTHGNFFLEDNFVCTAELLFNLKSLGAKCGEVPLVLRYDLKKGKSKMRVMNTILGYLKLLYNAKRMGRYA